MIIMMCMNVHHVLHSFVEHFLLSIARFVEDLSVVSIVLYCTLLYVVHSTFGTVSTIYYLLHTILIHPYYDSV